MWSLAAKGPTPFSFRRYLAYSMLPLFFFHRQQETAAVFCPFDLDWFTAATESCVWNSRMSVKGIWIIRCLHAVHGEICIAA